WDAIYRCSPSIRARICFSPERINEPCNGITMSGHIHKAFDKFKFAVEPAVSTLSPNHAHRIKTHRGFPTRESCNFPENRLVTFTNHCPT
ncbi:hypothetical protein BDZ91DRAFT_657449, partial [Kalaharituber pfeilii]